MKKVPKVHIKEFVDLCWAGPVAYEEYHAACGVNGDDLILVDDMQEITCKRCLYLCDAPEEVKA